MTALHYIIGFSAGATAIGTLALTVNTRDPWLIVGILYTIASAIISGINYKQ